MTLNPNYEVSSEGAVRHWEVPYARLTNATPVATEPAELQSVIPGTQLTGTVLTVDAGDSVAVIDFTCSMVYAHAVRNVLTYAAAVEATWGALNIGDPVFYDNSATMPAGVFLSTSPLDNLGVANTLFGYIVPASDADMALFPKGGVVASTQSDVAIMQVGAGH